VNSNSKLLYASMIAYRFVLLKATIQTLIVNLHEPVVSFHSSFVRLPRVCDLFFQQLVPLCNSITCCLA
jgi:hypothetical protein